MSTFSKYGGWILGTNFYECIWPTFCFQYPYKADKTPAIKAFFV